MREVGNEHDENLIKNPLAAGFMRGSWRAGKSAGLKSPVMMRLFPPKAVLKKLLIRRT